MKQRSLEPQAFANHFESWLIEEIAAQRALSDLLRQQLAAVRSGATQSVEEIANSLEAQLSNGTPRELRRNLLVDRLASTLEIARKGITLERILELLSERGVDVERLRGLRTELRDEVARLLKLNRRVATLARYHQGLFNEVLNSLADAAGGAETEPMSGSLVNAEV